MGIEIPDEGPRHRQSDRRSRRRLAVRRYRDPKVLCEVVPQLIDDVGWSLGDVFDFLGGNPGRSGFISVADAEHASYILKSSTRVVQLRAIPPSRLGGW